MHFLCSFSFGVCCLLVPAKVCHWFERLRRSGAIAMDVGRRAYHKILLFSDPRAIDVYTFAAKRIPEGIVFAIDEKQQPQSLLAYALKQRYNFTSADLIRIIRFLSDGRDDPSFSRAKFRELFGMVCDMLFPSNTGEREYVDQLYLKDAADTEVTPADRDPETQHLWDDLLEADHANGAEVRDYRAKLDGDALKALRRKRREARAQQAVEKVKRKACAANKNKGEIGVCQSSCSIQKG